MKTKIISMLVLFLVMTSAQTQATLIWDSGHHVFSEGYESHIWMSNDASAEIIGGTISEFLMYNITTANITGGYISALVGQDTSSVYVYENSDIHLLRPNDSSTANVYGGTIDYLFALGSSSTNIYSGLLCEIAAKDLSIINLYTVDCVWDKYGGSREGGQLTGTWFYGGDSFVIDLVTSSTINHINYVPEPCMFVLLASGGFFLNRREIIRGAF